MENFKDYYKLRISDCAKRNQLREYTEEILDQKSESELITIWDHLRWKYEDLARHNRWN
jgi:hypothetical protein